MTTEHYKFRYRDCAEALAEAFAGDPFCETLSTGFPDGSRKQDLLLTYLDFSLSEARDYGELFMIDSGSSGASVWLKPQAADIAATQKQSKVDFFEAHLGKSALDTYNRIVDFMSKNVQGVVDDNAWYLSILGVAPRAQGRGLGKKLVEEVLARSDAQGHPTYLETFAPDNERFYNGLGYRRVGKFFEPTIGAEYLVMSRVANVVADNIL